MTQQAKPYIMKKKHHLLYYSLGEANNFSMWVCDTSFLPTKLRQLQARAQTKYKNKETSHVNNFGRLLCVSVELYSYCF